ncbi:YjzD family protein [Metabacillus sp. 84]|uniref:YjzD family protein n=1 Tax=Metabacillus sp. 84 TaxID=3404705 RepID=UPI003CFAFF10
MRFFWTFFWSFLLVHMLTYVTSSMVGSAYDFMTATILSIGAAILINAIAAFIPDEPVSSHH